MLHVHIFFVARINEDRRNLADLRKALLCPSLAALSEDGLQAALKQSAGVLKILFGIGFGCGDAVKRFVEDADDSFLFGEGRNRNFHPSYQTDVQVSDGASCG